MKTGRGDFKAYVDSLPDGPEKAEALKALAQIRQLDEVEEESSRAHTNALGYSHIDRIGFFVFFCILAGFLINGLYRGRFPNFFIKQAPYTYWSNEPYIFGFIAVFLGALALIFLGIALGIKRIGRRHPFS